VRNRRRERLGEDLPLFREPEAPLLDVELPEPILDAANPPSEAPAALEPEPQPAPEPEPPAPRVAERWSLGEDDAEPEPVSRSGRAGAWVFDAPTEEEAPDLPPLERPAPWGDRLQAAAFDLGILAVIWSIVVYFASRAAQVSVDALEPVWPALGAYLGFLGLLYAVYFTGTCGRTIGKIVCGLKVVDVAGRPPGYPRALLRAVLGSVGVLLGMLPLLPVFFDPARRALHDRLLRVRVVKY
jgi:uncharacterized RDD family membrane protein YckC